MHPLRWIFTTTCMKNKRKIVSTSGWISSIIRNQIQSVKKCDCMRIKLVFLVRPGVVTHEVSLKRGWVNPLSNQCQLCFRFSPKALTCFLWWLSNSQWKATSKENILEPFLTSRQQWCWTAFTKWTSSYDEWKTSRIGTLAIIDDILKRIY